MLSRWQTCSKLTAKTVLQPLDVVAQRLRLSSETACRDDQRAGEIIGEADRAPRRALRRRQVRRQVRRKSAALNLRLRFCSNSPMTCAIRTASRSAPLPQGVASSCRAQPPHVPWASRVGPSTISILPCVAQIACQILARRPGAETFLLREMFRSPVQPVEMIVPRLHPVTHFVIRKCEARGPSPATISGRATREALRSARDRRGQSCRNLFATCGAARTTARLRRNSSRPNIGSPLPPAGSRPGARRHHPQISLGQCRKDRNAGPIPRGKRSMVVSIWLR